MTTTMPTPPPSHEPGPPALPPSVAGVPLDTGSLWQAMATLGREIWHSAFRRPIVLLAAGIAVAIAANMVGQVRLNRWYGDLFDALEQNHVGAFGHQMMVFLVIVAVLLALVVAQTLMGELLKLRLREWMSTYLLDQWLAPGRPYRLGLAGPQYAHPDQRIEEDTRKLTELSATLGIGLLQSTLLLGSFIGILWVLSADVVFVVDAHRFAIPGYMVWCAIAYALAGSLLTWRVGWPLVRLNADRYMREADLRFALVRVSESAEGIALLGGEPTERSDLQQSLDAVIVAMRRLAMALARLTWITSGYGWLAIAVPILVAAPGYFSGGLSLGGLMMVVGAFNQVQQSLRWFVDNFATIADWRATLHRICAFRTAVVQLESFQAGTDQIALAAHPAGGLAFNHVCLLLADGRVRVGDGRVDIAPGDRVQITADPGTDTSALYRAITGLWPWGAGTILLPPRADMMFMPSRPYLPLGSLRAAVTYPDAPDAFPAAAVETALRRVGLEQLLPLLDAQERVDKLLARPQVQLLAFARLLLHKPRWVLVDDATSALEGDSRAAMHALLSDELADAAVLSIGEPPPAGARPTRTVRLHRMDPDAWPRQTLDLQPSGGWRWRGR